MSEEEKGNQQTDNTEKQQPDEKGNQQTGKNLQSKKGCWHRIKKTAKWTALSLLILIILIPILVYLPPIQRFAVDKASKWLSEETGMDVTVGKFSLGFPLDLNMGDVLAVQDGDTMVYAENLDVSLQLMPLLKSKVVVDNVQLDNAVLHTNDLIEALRLDGRVGVEDHTRLEGEEVHIEGLARTGAEIGREGAAGEFPLGGPPVGRAVESPDERVRQRVGGHQHGERG